MAGIGLPPKKGKVGKTKRLAISAEVRATVLGRQLYKCANAPGSNLKNIGDYKCPMHLNPEANGSFDQSGYCIDHIIPHAQHPSNLPEALQALCTACHSVKTRHDNSDTRKK